MRLRKGSKVEVMNKKEVPVSWRTAEILSGNGHTYSVHYDYPPVMDSGSLMEKVSRKLVRPRPPYLIGDQTREVGEAVEVFHNLSWKIATILKILPGDYYTVRLSGSCMESTLHKSNIRDQLLWLDDKWILMGKSSGACEVELVGNLSPSKYSQKKVSGAKTQKRAPIGSCVRFQEKTGVQESDKVLSRSLKRASPCWSSVCESHVGSPQKCRAVEKDGRRQRMTTPVGFEKVDVTHTRDVMGKLHMHTLLEDGMIRYNEPKRGKIKCNAGFPGSSEPHDSDTVSSSVGSCSAVSVGQNGSSNGFVRVSCQVSDELCSDAESFSTDDEEICPLSPSEEEQAVSIHDLELRAYRSTLKVLHASGPLSWEQESMLTNLRIMLHVSNDEHLMEIRAR
ncbi:OLC1v1030255C7 [Oldenlandia corymbosa var. corymbosa]|uniref:OLC1v1030255C7 n=1 Tax=Oldenlandia corymbosa var. corymbosa TaxID=529605 RepID=A0AAV1CGE6_OLDCO|nr:OLC1v1030255C7 [Oldenlandia corymbosa var. corymbosa]